LRDPASEFINWLETIFMKEEIGDRIFKAAMFTVVGQVKQDGGWAAWCRRITGVFQKYTELYKKQWR
jgi:hypothetical protein